MNDQALQQAWLNLPENATSADIITIFIPEFLNALGFNRMECVSLYPTGTGTQAVDYALRHNTEDDIFFHTRSNPSILIEIKNRKTNLKEGYSSYKSTVEQIHRYLLAPNCKTARWGIITNADRIQLFRKHGKVIYPATQCLEVKEENIGDIVQDIVKK
ncbi:MAG: type I restriction enzyme HsdR N-terminal domain-containing protein [Cyanobacteriota bacterium]|nr:type I restriction enzyme HsdR N-terminal domain-containing protein [Cyanobacteriota bacterium]